MYQLIFYLVIIVVIVYIIGYILAAIVGVGLVIVACICIGGFLWGCGVAVKNFSEVFVEAHKRLP